MTDRRFCRTGTTKPGGRLPDGALGGMPVEGCGVRRRARPRVTAIEGRRITQVELSPHRCPRISRLRTPSGRPPRRCCRGHWTKSAVIAGWYLGHRRGSCSVSAPSSTALACQGAHRRGYPRRKAMCTSSGRARRPPPAGEIQKSGSSVPTDGDDRSHDLLVPQHREGLVRSAWRRRGPHSWIPK